MSTPTEQDVIQVEREVLAELDAGNWPVCEMCHRFDQVGYMGMCIGIPTFACARCSFVFAMDLLDAEGGE